jgi:hypothetical protein
MRRKAQTLVAGHVSCPCCLFMHCYWLSLFGVFYIAHVAIRNKKVRHLGCTYKTTLLIRVLFIPLCLSSRTSPSFVTFLVTSSFEKAIHKMANYQQGENYISGNNTDYATDYSNNNYANGNEMVDLNARRKAALAEVNNCFFAHVCLPFNPSVFYLHIFWPYRSTTPSSAGSTFVPVLYPVSVSTPILMIFSLSVWSLLCSDGFIMLPLIRLRKLSLSGWRANMFIFGYLVFYPTQPTIVLRYQI